MPVIVAPSLLAADFSRLRQEVGAVEAAGADWLHLDIMDGHFVPNISFGPGLLKSLRPHTRLPFDVHLMIEPVDPYIEAFAEAGADHILFHPEAGPHPHRTLQTHPRPGQARRLGAQSGNPAGIGCMDARPDRHTACDDGQSRIRRPDISALAITQNRRAAPYDRSVRAPIRLAVDGGIEPDSARQVIEAGADTLIAGTAVFGRGDYARSDRGPARGRR